MKRILIIITSLLYFALNNNANAQNCNFIWAKGMGGTGGDIGNSIAIDANGNVYTTGSFSGIVDFDPGLGVYSMTSAGDDDIFISKLDASGNFLWAKQLGGVNNENSYSIAVDANGNIYTTGVFYGIADFDPGPGVYNMISAGNGDIFISKLDASGNFLWAKKFGGVNQDAGRSIVVDANGNVFTTGFFYGTVDFDPGPGTYNLIGNGGAFISKLDSFGNFLLAKGFRVADEYSIVVDGNGNIYSSGIFFNTVDFDPGPGIYNLTSSGDREIFVSKLDASGNFLWAKQFGGVNDDGVPSIAIDVNGNVYSTGYFTATADFDPSPGTYNMTSSGVTDIYVSKLDASGNFLWAKQLGGVNNENSYSIAVDANGNVYTTGKFSGIVDFDPGPGVYNMTSAGIGDIFISKLDASGNFLLAKQLVGAIIAFGMSITVDTYGNVYETGSFSGTFDFDPDLGTYNMTSVGVGDIFVLKLGINNNSQDQWKWLKGDSTINQGGVYGNQGTPSPANKPGARASSVSWTDRTGNLWLFGGNGKFNDLWKYNPSTNLWTWVKGDNTLNQAGVYGTQGTPDPANKPGGREEAVSWTDGNGNLWLFGGYGHDSGVGIGFLNDLWKYDPSTNQWTWVKGDNIINQLGVYGIQGTSDPANRPGARRGVSWTDTSGNLWLFGGYGYDVSSLKILNDLWKYDPSTNQWTWIKGDNTGNHYGVYGIQGTAAPVNKPGSREFSASWTDGSGNFWLFGGIGYATSTLGTLNDLWKYNPSTNQWTWIKGDNINGQVGVYGTQGLTLPTNKPGARGTCVSWTDNDGNLLLFGGDSFTGNGISSLFNDIWKYNPSNNQWTWVKGNNVGGQVGIYGTQGSSTPANKLGARHSGVSWTDRNGNYWLFGGNGVTTNTTQGGLNDLWKLGDNLYFNYPKITLGASSVNAGQSISITGTDFKHNGVAEISIQGPGGFSQSISNINTNAQGGFLNSYVTTISMPLGFYTVLARDTVSGLTSPLKSFNLSGADVTSYLQIVYPTIGVSLNTNQNINIEWKDKLVLGNNYTVVGSKRNYKYTVEYSDNGGLWQNIGTVQGLDYINTYVSLSKGFTHSTASNNLRVRITDFYNTSNITTSSVFNVINPAATNLQVNLDWDFSYPAPSTPIQGLAADGNARIFMNLSKIIPTGPDISSVSVTLSDAFNGTNTAKLGKVKVAIQTSAYSSEANGIMTISAIDNTPNKSNYIFWYVAPDDFVGNDIQDSISSFRYVDAFFNVIYTNSTAATFTKRVKIVRPPLMLVHGLGGDATTWDNFRHNALGAERKFIYDNRFIKSRAVNIKPNAAFSLNAFEMTLGNSTSNPNTFVGVINEMRNQGYATNRVDYVCHSMGGAVLRSIFDNWYPQFTRTGAAVNRPYKNYESGYVNKVIMIDVPNNSSPWADITNRYVGDLPLIARIAIQSWYGFSAQEITFPLIFIKPTDPNAFIWSYEPSDAVRDLQIDNAQGGVNFGVTNTKAHLIAGDFFPGTQFNTNGLIPQQVINYVKNSGDNMTQKFLNYLLKVASSLETDPQLKAALLNIIQNNDDPVVSALDFLNKMAMVMDAFNTGTFIPESDLVVSVKSQLAGHSKSDPNCSSFDNFVGHAFFRPVMKNVDVGNRVNYLLNSSINSSLFDIIDATSNRISNPSNLPPLNNNPIISRKDTSKLQISSPQNNTSIYVDSTLHIKIKVNDTTNLRNLEVNFQNKTYKVDSLFLGTVDLNVQINANILDSLQLVAEGFYDYQDSAVFIYDQVKTNIITTSTLTRFGANPDVLFLFKDQYKYPDYYGIYQDFTTSTGNFSPYISVVVNDTAIVKYDLIARGFKGISNGETYAIVSYQGLSDTIYFVVGRCLSASNTATIDTSGNTTFCSPNSITLTAASGMAEYLWSNGATTQFINVNTTGNYSVIITDSVGCSASSPFISVNVNHVPAQPGPINGSNTICRDSTKIYTVTAVPNATSFTWILPPGWTGSSITNSIQATASPNSGTISVKANNNCGSSLSQTLAVTVNAVPTVSNAGPDQTGSSTCGLSTTTLAANTPTVGTGNWSIVAGAGGVITTSTSPTSTFTGTAGTTYTLRWTISNSFCTASTDDVFVTFNRNPTASNAGPDQNICATTTTLAANSPSIGTGLWSVVSGTATITSSASPTSGITGLGVGANTLRWTISNLPCTPSTDDVVITVSADPTASNAGPDQNICATTTTLAGNSPSIGTGLWSVVSGTATITSPASPTSGITGLGVGANTLRWTISNLPCTPSTDDVLITVNQVPAQPGTINGISTICKDSTQTYSVPTVAGVVSYIWTLPAGWSGSSTTNTIQVTANSNSGTISVKANNNCGSSPDQTLAITVNQVPAQPGTITGNILVNTGETLNYSISQVNGATGYNWLLSGGGNITTGQNTTMISINWLAQGNYNLTVNATNSCGSGNIQTLNITASLLTGIINPDNAFQIKIIPNPSSGEFYLTAKAVLNKDIDIVVSNILGQNIFLKHVKVGTNDFTYLINLTNVAAGIYNVKITIGKKVYFRKITKIN